MQNNNPDTVNPTPGTFDFQKSLKKREHTILNRFVKVERYLFRPPASLVVKMIFKTRITPNEVTLFSFLIGIVGAFFFSRGTPFYFLMGGIFAQLSFILDCADGMLARAKNMCSEYGSHLDLFLDRIIDFSIIVSIGIGAHTYFDDSLFLTLGLLTGGLYLLQINMFYLTNSYLQVKEKGGTAEARAVLFLGILVTGIFRLGDIFIYLMLSETIIVSIFRLFHFISLGKKQV